MKQLTYQQQLDETLAALHSEGRIPTLLLHACCAPCSSYTLEYLNAHFDITVLFYNPNISSEEEYQKRILEEQRFLKEYPFTRPVRFVEGPYEPARFREAVKGLEALPEGGERCYRCYELRLRESAVYAALNGFEYFTTTLSISPHKNARRLNEIGVRLEQEYGVRYLVSDFKKKNGYRRSIELSERYHLYRQNFCGCAYSRRERERADAQRAVHSVGDERILQE